MDVGEQNKLVKTEALLSGIKNRLSFWLWLPPEGGFCVRREVSTWKEQTGVPVFAPAHSSLAHLGAWEKPDQMVVKVQEPPYRVLIRVWVRLGMLLGRLGRRGINIIFRIGIQRCGFVFGVLLCGLELMGCFGYSLRIYCRILWAGIRRRLWVVSFRLLWMYPDTFVVLKKDGVESLTTSCSSERVFDFVAIRYEGMLLLSLIGSSLLLTDIDE